MSGSAQDYYPPAGFYFKVQLLDDSASADMGFQEVSGIDVSIEPETYSEGGLNIYKHHLPTTPRYSDLQLKRGFVLESQPFFEWCKATIQNGFATPVQPKGLNLQLLAAAEGSAEPRILKQWSFYNAWPTKWSLSEFNAQDGRVVIESITLSYSYFQME